MILIFFKKNCFSVFPGSCDVEGGSQADLVLPSILQTALLLGRSARGKSLQNRKIILKEAKPLLLLSLCVCGGINICWASSHLQARAITRGTGVLSSERFYFSQMWTSLQII